MIAVSVLNITYFRLLVFLPMNSLKLAAQNTLYVHVLRYFLVERLNTWWW